MKKILGIVMGALLAMPAFAAMTAVGGSWKPEHRVEVVVPNAPGGGNDRLVRLLLKIAQEQHTVDVIATIVNKPGAGVVMGLSYLNQVPGDGHRISIISSTFLGDYVSGRSAISPDDITPIAQLFTEYVGFAVKADSPLTSPHDVLARLKADPGSVSVALSGGPGNHNHIALALVARVAGVDPKKLKVVVYSSGGDALTSALGGHVDMVVAPAASILPHVKAGRLRFLALTAPKRLPGVFATVPVWREIGADVVSSNWRAMVGARGLPQPQQAYWEGVMARAVESPDWKQMLERDMVEPEFLRGSALREALKIQSGELKTVMESLGLIK